MCLLKAKLFIIDLFLFAKLLKLLAVNHSTSEQSVSFVPGMLKFSHVLVVLWLAWVHTSSQQAFPNSGKGYQVVRDWGVILRRANFWLLEGHPTPPYPPSRENPVQLSFIMQSGLAPFPGSGFLWHSSKWAHWFGCFLQYTSGLEVLAWHVASTLTLAMWLLHSNCTLPWMTKFPGVFSYTDT